MKVFTKIIKNFFKKDVFLIILFGLVLILGVSNYLFWKKNRQLEKMGDLSSYYVKYRYLDILKDSRNITLDSAMSIVRYNYKNNRELVIDRIKKENRLDYLKKKEKEYERVKEKVKAIDEKLTENGN
jgi:hypothetical protein